MASREAARRLVDELASAYNGRDIDRLVALYQSDVTYWSALGGLQEGVGAVREHLEHLHQTLPDEQMRPLTVITDGDVVVVEFESTGTNPAGNPYRIEFTEVFHLREGKIARIQVYLDPEEVARAMS